MKWIVILLGIPIGLYVLVVMVAGIGVLISERKFRKSPEREGILEVIQITWNRIKEFPDGDIDQLIQNGMRSETCHRGKRYSVDVTITKKKNSYEVMISVGLMARVTFGHVEKFELLKSEPVAGGDATRWRS